MHLVSINNGGPGSPGVVIGDEILDLYGFATITGAERASFRSMRDLLGAGDMGLSGVRRNVDRVLADASLADRLKQQNALLPRRSAALVAPVTNAQLILSAGMNYYGHLKEMNTPPPPQPSAFIKCTGSVIGPEATIELPPAHPDMVDWEGEFSAVIGRPCYRVSAADSLDYVAGYTLINDVSARDWVAPVFSSTGIMGPIHAWEHNLLGKQFPSFCPMGPVIVTRDELPDPDDVHLTTRLNGQIMQDTNTSDLVFNVPRLIEHFSQFYRFVPGDVITTGSPGGVGFGRNPKIFMRAGDRIEVAADAIGVLANPIGR